MHMTELTRTPTEPLDRKPKRMLERISFLRQWFEPSIEGLENIPPDHGTSLVINHVHFRLDLLLLSGVAGTGNGAETDSAML